MVSIALLYVAFSSLIVLQEKEAEDLMVNSFATNFVDWEEYPQTAGNTHMT